MGGFMRRTGFRTLGGLAILLLAVPWLGLAQDTDEDEDYPHTATLTLYSWQDGQTQANFYSSVPIDDMEGLRAALNMALHCNLAPPPMPQYAAQQIPDPEQRKQIQEA